MRTKNFMEVTNEWLDTKKISVKYPTYVKYELVVNRHIKTFFKDYTIEEINDELVLSFFNKLYEQYANKTLINIRSIFSSINQYIQKKYDVKGCHMDLIRINNRNDKINTLTDYQKINLSNYCFKNYKPISIAVLIGLYGGLRIGEICALQWKDINYSEGYISVNKTVERLKSKEMSKNKTTLMLLNPKTLTSKRIVPIPTFLIDYIKEYQNYFDSEDNENFILTNSDKIPDPRTTQYRFVRLCNEFDFRANFHSLRHSYATSCVMQDIDTKSLSEILGHSNVGITLNLYVHSSFDFKRRQISKISKL